MNLIFQPKYVSPEEQALLSLPEHLSKSHSKKNEEMLSSQMLSGIPEVDLGIDEKIRNIEATEFAKKRLAEERNKKNKLIGKNRKHFIKDVSWYLCFIYFDLKKCKYSFHEIFRTVILVIMYCFILWEPLVLLIFRRGHNTTVLKLNSLSFINHQIKDTYHYEIKYE